jgi:hypothetical protein
VILVCIEEQDDTIRRIALEILSLMVDKKNLLFIVNKIKSMRFGDCFPFCVCFVFVFVCGFVCLFVVS